MIQIETQRLVLRELQADDALPLNTICNEPYILRWMPDWKSTVEERLDWILWAKSQYSEFDKNQIRIILAVTLKSSGQLMGLVGVANKREVNNEIEIAYFIAERFSGKGYISEASKAMTQWAFETASLDTLISIVEPENIPSWKVLEHCGFTRMETRMIVNFGETEEKPFYYYRLLNFVKGA